MTRSIFCLLRIFQLQSSNGDIERLRESINLNGLTLQGLTLIFCAKIP